MYNWQYSNWPHFNYSLEKLEDRLITFTRRAGLLTGLVQAMPQSVQLETIIHMMVEEAVKTSEIEGEYVSRPDVLSSIQRNLKIQPSQPQESDLKAIGVGKLMTMVRDQFSEPLTKEMVFEWHRALLQGTTNLLVGSFREDPNPMQVISGVMGRLTIHLEAPPMDCVSNEMRDFFNWFNATNKSGVDGIKMAPIRAAIAHLYFESIHPFDDGNGRIGRAISEKALSQGLGHPLAFSLSETIMTNRAEYYNQLERAQKTLEITDWISWFLEMVLDAQQNAEQWIQFTLQKERYFRRYGSKLNERQTKVILRMFEEGPSGFIGGMNARKYIGITKTSKATATRDLQELLEIGVFNLRGNAGGRSTSYELNLDES